MKPTTKLLLRRIIKEEVRRVLKENESMLSWDFLSDQPGLVSIETGSDLTSFAIVPYQKKTYLLISEDQSKVLAFKPEWNVRKILKYGESKQFWDQEEEDLYYYSEEEYDNIRDWFNKITV